ncbi:unnamed protein product [Urochloa decumbens]|uniref:Aldose 1-epimerase n=1 Tax=Urochloa decumbens TaxID=240449 RepID=A0ABC9C966_9POAL
MARRELFLALMCVAASALDGGASARTMVGVYELKKGDFSVKVTNWGATIMSVILPDSRGRTRGGRGFHKVVWTVKEYVAGGDSPYITLYYRVSAGSGSPYALGVHMNATALDKATPVNLLRHTYWNLAGHGHGDVLGHTLRLFASRYTPLDAEMLPSSGRVASVAGTPFGFRAPTPIGARIRGVMGGRVAGYDDANYVVDGEPGAMRPVAAVWDGASGRALELWGNQPCVQLYTANWLNHTAGKAGEVYDRYAGFCLETQGYPDAVNHPAFPSQILRRGQVYRHDMVFKLSF